MAHQASEGSSQPITRLGHWNGFVRAVRVEAIPRTDSKALLERAFSLRPKL